MKIISKNKIAYRDYSFEKNYELGIVLLGHEVKSIKMGQVNIRDAIVRIQNRELWVKNMDIPLYKKTSPILAPGYQAKRDRKLLVKKRELAKISALTDKSGNTIIPLKIYLNHKGFIKLEVGIGKLMRKIEKKQILKEKDIKREMDREIRS
ncbi:MAG: SsrA-binding protein SmpB [Candidatus Absconditabacterales bacterium]|nr:SsrA-binding protein SmpB [Candidatus Absconditabacterales bacterium]